MSKVFLSPSSIHFLKSSEDKSLFLPDKDLLRDLSSKFTDQVNVPKIQVTQKDGVYFALNNASLHVFRDLEMKGKCPPIPVEVVPLSMVPHNVQNNMVLESNFDDQKAVKCKSSSTESCSCNQESQRKANIDSNVHPSVELSISAQAYLEQTDEAGTSNTTSSSESSSSETEDQNDSDNDEVLICNVCDRSFRTSTSLGNHQLRRKHFGCSVCDALFPDLSALELHKETLEHWSDNEGKTSDYSQTSDEEREVLKRCEELERLL